MALPPAPHPGVACSRSERATPEPTPAEETEIAALLETTRPNPVRRRLAAGASLASFSSSGLRPVEQGIAVGSLAWLLVGPRIELPILPGLRVEDLAFLLLAVLCVAHLRAVGRPTARGIATAAVVATGLLAAIVALALGTVPPLTSALFAVRPLEYWVVYPAARLLIAQNPKLWLARLRAVLAVVTVLQSAFAAAQYFLDLDIGFSHAAYTRASGLTVGPYELGAISAALLVYWVAQRRIVLTLLSALALAVSISRISIIGAVVALALLAGTALVQRARSGRTLRRPDWLRTTGRSRAQLLRVSAVLAAAAIAVGFIGGLASSPAGQQALQRTVGPITQRFASTSVVGSWDAAGELAAKVPATRTAAEYQAAAYTNLMQYVHADDENAPGAEASNLVRFFRWHLILDSFTSPVQFVFGLGPSFVGPSVDGSYLRFFADAGLLGVAAWVALIVTWFRRSPMWMAGVTVSMLIGALFIDIVYSQRPMVLFWLLLAIASTAQAAASPGRHRRLVASPLAPVRSIARRLGEDAGAGSHETA